MKVTLSILLTFLFQFGMLPQSAVAQEFSCRVPTPSNRSHSGEEANSARLKIGINVNRFQTFDPHRAVTTSDRMLADLRYNALIRYQPGNAPNLEPDLAKKIPEPAIINGKQTWTFHLQPDIYFHTVSTKKVDELTAEDVLLSFEKASDPKRSSFASAYQGISAEIVDEYTIRFTVDPPQSPLLFLPKVANYAGGFVVKEIKSPALSKNMPSICFIGTGPFLAEGFKGTNRFRLHANENYFRGKPKLSGIDVLFVPDTQKRFLAFDNDQLDLITGEPETEWINEAKTKTNAAIDIFGVSETANIYFNTLIKPLSDIRVRKAIAYALEKDQFGMAFGPDLVVNVYSPIPPFMPGGLDTEEIKALSLDYGHDIEKSKKLMAEAGYPDGFEFDVVTSDLGLYLNNYLTLKQQLKKINVRMNIRIVDHASMHNLIRKDLNPLVIYEAFRPTTDELLSRFFHSDSIVMTGVNPDTNFSHYVDIDMLIEKARNERITSKQIKLWEYSQIKLLEDMVVYPLHYRNLTYLRKSNVDYGHRLTSTMALYPQITEKTTIH